MDCITKTCLTCLEKTSQVRSLQDILQDNLKILEIIYKIVPVLLENHELTLPDWICSKCLEKLVISYNFQKLCLDSIQNLYKLEENSGNQTKKETQEDVYKQELLLEDNEDSLQSFDDNKIQFEEIPLDSKTENEDDLEMPFYHSDEEPEDSFRDDLEESEKGETTKSVAAYQTASFSCKLCKQVYKTRQGLASHKTRVHIKQYLYNCQECKRGFDDEELYTKHCNRHLGIKTFKCDQCDKVFDCTGTLNQHLISHSQETPYLCTICGKSFNRSGSLKQHILRHGNEKPFKCVICSKSFKCLSDQIQHMYIHKKKKDFVEEPNKSPSENNEDLSLGTDSKDERKTVEFKQETEDQEHEKSSQTSEDNDEDTMGSLWENKQELEKPFETENINNNKQDNNEKGTEMKQCFRIQELNTERDVLSETNQCNVCKRIFKNLHGLNVHYKKKHLKTHLYNCDKCEKGFDAEEYYIKHYNLHLGIKPFKCEQCEKTFENRYCYNQHLITHSEESQFPCALCGKSFRRRGILKQHHQRIHTGQKPFKCKYCSRTFSLGCDMKMHRKRIHKDIKSEDDSDESEEVEWWQRPIKVAKSQRAPKQATREDKPNETEPSSKEENSLLTVNEDKKVIAQQETNEDSLNDVLKLNESGDEENLLEELKPKKPNQCKICKHIFRTAQGLASHRTKAHIKIYQYNCDKCYKGFDSEENYKKHLDRHLGVKAFKCPQCGKAFDSTGTLNQHLICHSNETPHLCTICGKSFNRSGTLKQHILRHGSEKKYKCTLCPKSFKCLPDQISHMYKHNGRRYVCNICGASLTTSSSLSSHKLIHTGERPFKCDQCDKSFNLSSNLNVHKRIHTGEKPYSCPYCEKTFRQSNDRNKHATRVHRKEIAEAKAAESQKIDEILEQNV